MIINELKRMSRISEFNTVEKARLRGGLLMGDWIDRMRNVSQGMPVKPRKMQLYSAHDGTVLALMYALGVGNDQLVPYAACLIMELYLNGNSTTVKVFLKNETKSKTIHQLPLPGCGLSNCTVSEFEVLVASGIIRNVDQLELACNLDDEGSSTGGLLTASFIALSSLTLLLLSV